MMRIVLAAGVVIAAISFDVKRAPAAEGPWCAFIETGVESVYEDCRYRTFEECMPNVISGNRGFCNHNPRWTGLQEPAGKPRAHKKRRTQPQ